MLGRKVLGDMFSIIYTKLSLNRGGKREFELQQYKMMKTLSSKWSNNNRKCTKLWRH